ncbi:AraC family transcriptional regulator [Flavobacterium sp. MC2016-06]|jgi:AraC family transcriptional activator of pobA|uniref:AraC family transcriptional regulator n=1 Tax=Flavobacterium sp. MC2016-06 TaxID=2676308 RepID=UPI0012BB18F3|nr:AraC family transcriptional regulator [Flavobacterium sp. MC2016-06]MBU3857611.1 AraC family transcriptional regulator [Flavobacterium sp. MC2016-06]
MQKAHENINKITDYHLNHYHPNKPRMAIYQITNYLKKYDKKARRTHTDKYFKIIWFKTGKGRHFIDHKGYEIIDNTIFFIKKDQIHSFDKNISYEGILIYFNEPFLIKNKNDTNFFLKHDLFNNTCQPPYCYLNTADTFLLNEYMSLIENELTNEDEVLQEEILRTYLKVFMMQLHHHKNRFNQINANTIFHTDKKQMKIMQFVDMIEENYKRELKVPQYAALLHISPRTLSNLTHKVLDKSPSQMIQERIILEAEQMLINTDSSITKISSSLGFTDLSYFVKYFKNHTDKSPSDFRKSITHK